jgi:uncharacterized damage-inducible protein DinB
MESIEHYRRLFSYDDWANRAVLAALRDAGNPPTRSLKLMAHVFAAERVWLERLEQKKQSVPVWPVSTLEQCDSEAEDMSRSWKKFLQGKKDADLAVTISYKNSKGESWESRKDDVLQHVIMHSAYHRGQIAADMRAAGFTPAYTDFIHGVRQGLVK